MSTVKTRTGPTRIIKDERTPTERTRMATLARTMAAAMTISVMLTVGLAFIGGEAQRAEALTYGSGCAQMLQNPSDANCHYYGVSRYRYFHWTNDLYTAQYHWLKEHNHARKAHIMLRAAQYTCRGTLYEDFSCSGPKR